MKQAWLHKFGFVLFLSVLVSACTATREQEVEGDVNEFRSWVNAQTTQLAERTEEDWKSTKADFRRRTEELDRKQDRFSDRIKSDYQQIKADFKARELERDRLSERQRELLGEFAPRSAVTSVNVKRAYVTFMDNVRDRHVHWEQDDWEMADMVLNELDKRKASFDELADEDEVQIKALKMEFEALKAGVETEE
jgi:hypothetical protein